MAQRDDALRRRARRAYELGRLRVALYRAWPAYALVTVVALLGEPSVFGLALMTTAIGLTVYGRGMDWGIRTGVFAGAVPALAALATQSHGCSAASCSALCIPVCTGAGVLVGVWLGTRLGRSRRPAAPVLTLAVIAAATGCTVVGVGALVGATLGLALGAAPVWLATRHSV